MTHCYLLISGTRTYIGATYDPDHRLRQHNGELVGGAKATSGHKWERVMLVSGFADWRTTLQFEWAWKYFSRKTGIKGLPGRIAGLYNLLHANRATKNAVPFKEWASEVSVRPEEAWYGRVEKIEAWSRLVSAVGSHFRVIIPSSDPSAFLSFRMSSSKSSSPASASSADIAALTKVIQALVEQQATNNKVVTAVLERMSKMSGGALVAPKVVEDAPTKGKRGRKPKAEPKEKVLPPTEEGTIRTGSASEGEYKELSSFFKAPFKVDGKEYLSLANYFNSQKFAGTDDDFSEDIRTQKNPALTRAKASSIKEHAVRADWDTAKLDVMRAGLLAKFQQNTALKRKLINTGESPIQATIEEEMRIKGFWSIGEDGAGENQMGKLIESVRDELRSAAGADEDEEAPKPVAKPAAKPKPAAKAQPAKAQPAKAQPAKEKAADSDDEDSDSDDEEETTAKPVSKAPAPKAKPAAPTAKPAAKPVSTAQPTKAADSDSDDSDSDED
jgi:ribA/ribD-fused uncharacterized protein